MAAAEMRTPGTPGTPSPADIERFRITVERRLGLAFDAGKLDTLGEVLRRRALDNSRPCSAYVATLEAVGGQAELQALARELTVTETYFFRNSDQFRALAGLALPERARAQGARRRLRMLSAACASGEEPYTLAMVARAVPELAGWDVAVRAIDINTNMLERAARARYTSWALRETPPDMQARHFRAEGRDVVLERDVRAMVTFEERNLITEEFAALEPDGFDVVFCRNVLMYFAAETAQAVVVRLARALRPGGYLFLGHAETLRGLSHDFHLRHTHGAFYYQLREDHDPARPRLPEGEAGAWDLALALTVRTEQPAAAPTPAAPAAPTAAELAARTESSWVETIRRASERIQSLTAPDDQGEGTDGSGWDLSPALALMHEERFNEAQALLAALPAEAARDPDVLLLRAVLHTHGGDLLAAEGICGAVLDLDEMSAGAHYLKALCREHAGDRQRAADCDQIAAYLDPTFAMPRLHLGLLARRAGDQLDARRELREALALLQREDPSRLLLFGGGFSREGLLALCRAELLACGGRS